MCGTLTASDEFGDTDDDVLLTLLDTGTEAERWLVVTATDVHIAGLKPAVVVTDGVPLLVITSLLADDTSLLAAVTGRVLPVPCFIQLRSRDAEVDKVEDWLASICAFSHDANFYNSNGHYR